MTQNINTLVPIWTFSLRGVLSFGVSDINGCVSYFEGTANLHCYTSCTLTILHCSKVSFLQCRHMKREHIYKNVMVYFCEILYVYDMKDPNSNAIVVHYKNVQLHDKNSIIKIIIYTFWVMYYDYF